MYTPSNFDIESTSADQHPSSRKGSRTEAPAIPPSAFKMDYPGFDDIATVPAGEPSAMKDMGVSRATPAEYARAYLAERAGLKPPKSKSKKCSAGDISAKMTDVDRVGSRKGSAPAEVISAAQGRVSRDWFGRKRSADISATLRKGSAPDAYQVQRKRAAAEAERAANAKRKGSAPVGLKTTADRPYDAMEGTYDPKDLDKPERLMATWM